MRKKRSLISIFLPVMILLVIWLGICVKFYFFPNQIKSEHTIELGEKIEGSPADYLEGLRLDDAVFDDSAVDYDNVGTYSYSVIVADSFRNLTFPCTLTIEDTTSPELFLREDDIYLAVNKEVKVDELIAGASDLDEVEVFLWIGGKESESFLPKETGTFTLTAVARDFSGNETRADFEVLADTPPRIVGARNRFIKTGINADISEINLALKELVLPLDDVDGILADALEVDNGGLDTDVPGEYTVTYTAKDNYGLEGTAECIVTVGDAFDKEARASNGRLWSEKYELSDEDFAFIDNHGYFTYEPLPSDNDDVEAVAELIEPALVDFYWLYNSGGFSGPNDRIANSYGSGMIYDITADSVFFLTVGHVADDFDRPCMITLFDGTEIIADTGGKYITADTNELAMIRIDRDKFPTERLMKCREICTDITVYDRLHKGDEVVTFAKFWKRERDLIKLKTVLDIKASETKWDGYDDILFTSNGVTGGMSGTATVDMTGCLVGAVSYTVNAKGENHDGDVCVDVLWTELLPQIHDLE